MLGKLLLESLIQLSFLELIFILGEMFCFAE